MSCKLVISLRSAVNQKGQTMVDLVMAFALLSLATTSAGVLATTSARVGGEAGRRTQATALATRELEGLRTLRDTLQRSGQGNLWDYIQVAGTSSTCKTVIVRRDSSDSWSTAAPTNNTHTAYSANDEEGFDKWSPFRRMVTICPGRDYNADISSYPDSNEVYHVLVEVAWDEGHNVERKVSFTTILTTWSRQ